MKDMKKTGKKLEYALFVIVTILYGVLSVPCIAFADDASAESIAASAMKPITIIVNVLFILAKGAGLVVAIKGAFDLFPAVSGHDSASVVKAILTIAAGALFFFLKQILTAGGISI